MGVSSLSLTTCCTKQLVSSAMTRVYAYRGVVNNVKSVEEKAEEQGHDTENVATYIN